MTDLTTDPLERFHEYGSQAAQRGDPKDACPYRRPDRVNAWVRGWLAGEDERLRLEGWRERQASRRVRA